MLKQIVRERERKENEKCLLTDEQSLRREKEREKKNERTNIARRKMMMTY
jgi:hypothetical protein